MYYLLRLDAYKIKKGTCINKSLFGGYGEIEYEYSGYLFDGSNLFHKISERYKIGDKTDCDIYDIDYSFMALDETQLGDFIHSDFIDLLESDLLEQWEDMNEPIIFLMNIYTEKVYGELGAEYDVIQHSVCVVSHDDLKALATNKK